MILNKRGSQLQVGMKRQRRKLLPTDGSASSNPLSSLLVVCMCMYISVATNREEIEEKRRVHLTLKGERNHLCI